MERKNFNCPRMKIWLHELYIFNKNIFRENYRQGVVFSILFSKVDACSSIATRISCEEVFYKRLFRKASSYFCRKNPMMESLQVKLHVCKKNFITGFLWESKKSFQSSYCGTPVSGYFHIPFDKCVDLMTMSLIK